MQNLNWLKKHPVRIVIFCGILLTCIFIWVSSSRILLPLCYRESDKTLAQDINGNTIAETYSLKDYTLVISENGQTLWTSPEDWKIQSFLLADVDHDKQKDLVMVVWKKGSFGRDKPFWLEQDERRYSSHLFVYGLSNNQVKPVWMSSALIRPICSLEVQDIDDDGKNELIIYEGTYALLSYLTQSQASQAQTSWKWEGWGFFQFDN